MKTTFKWPEEPNDKLSVEERLRLAQQIWDSVEEDIASQPESPELLAELERRMKHAQANPDEGVPWEVVKAEALARIRK